MRLVTRLVAVVLVGLALVYGGILLWTKVINKPEERLDTDALSQTLESAPPPTTEESVESTTVPDAGLTGMWRIGAGSTVGYRVKEVLGGVDTEGVGRTEVVTGSLTFDGPVLLGANFSVDVASITSDSGRRDAKFAGEIMEAATFPEATFRLTSPVEIASIPADGEQADFTVVGELSMHGVTNPVEFPVTAEYANSRIGVFGNIDIVFADYGIDNPSNNFVTTGDTGIIEFILVFERI